MFIHLNQTTKMENNVFVKSSLLIAIMLKYCIHSTTSVSCNKTNYWCSRRLSGLIYLDQRFPSLNQTTFKTCIEICTANVTCKTFEYDSTGQRCRFSSVLYQNMPIIGRANNEVFWKTSLNVQCRQAVTNQGKNIHCT